MLVAYKLWIGYLAHFDKSFKYGIGAKIDALFIETMKNLFVASHTGSERKRIFLTKASDTFDILKFLMQVVWEIKILDNKKYITISEKLNEIGRMLGGWRKKTTTP